MAVMTHTTMNYYLDPSKGGVRTCTFGTAGVLRRKFDTQPIQVQNARGREEMFNDIHSRAFRFCKWKPSTESLDAKDIKTTVYQEAEEFVKKMTGATQARCFSHLIRLDSVESNMEALDRIEATLGKDAISDHDGFGKIAPARYAHVDQSAKGARTLLCQNLPGEALNLMNTRWGTVNLWRPIRTVHRDPLCLVDGRTLSDEDLVPMDAIPPPKGTSELYESVSKGDGFQTLEIRANPQHKWYYVSEMKPDEAWMFKGYDSKDTSESRCCHASFKHTNTSDEEPRQSMELRFFVFYENDPL
ncbi:hypothetical protein GGR57DRAFT_490730 [Xylariaceae sp. FL1272]|nr:hypothetical protein GGR57DRAFT_490730 [Xylariaceae sp. FL1272]